MFVSIISFQVLLSLSACVVVAVLWKYFWASKRPMNFPPGPPTSPFVGNLHQLPQSKAFLKYYNFSLTSVLVILSDFTIGFMNGLKRMGLLLASNWALRTSLF